MFHLTKDEIDRLNSEKVTESKSYNDMKEQAEES
jgi:hypothetical protein